jgi:hypothetical protein
MKLKLFFCLSIFCFIISCEAPSGSECKSVKSHEDSVAFKIMADSCLKSDSSIIAQKICDSVKIISVKPIEIIGIKEKRSYSKEECKIKMRGLKIHTLNDTIVSINSKLDSISVYLKK